MNQGEILASVAAKNIKEDLPDIAPGDTLQVHVRVIEGGKERIQVFEGTVIGLKHGGVAESVTVRKISHSIGVERSFPLHSPRVAKFVVTRKGKVRRAKLYYLRKKIGKAARIKEKR
jgi:large subunit ribosomal protein L19